MSTRGRGASTEKDQATKWPRLSVRAGEDTAHVSSHRGQAPRDSLLHPVWEPAIDREPAAEAFVARCLLGAGWVGAKRRLSMFDLRTWAALCGQLHAQHLRATGEHDPDLDRVSSRTVETTQYQLADLVMGRDALGGDHRRRLRQSLARLQGAIVTVRAVEADDELAAERMIEGWVPLIGEVWAATTRLDLTKPREWGALKGTTSLRVEIGRWAAEQVIAQRCTWLDLEVLRALGPGLPARVWACLEAWARWPQRSFDGLEEAVIGLGQPALESLGVARYARPKDARRALDRAGNRIIASDPAYVLVRCEKRAGWCLVIRRRVGARTRGELRRQLRATAPERSVVRAAIHESLAEAVGAQRAA